MAIKEGHQGDSDTSKEARVFHLYVTGASPNSSRAISNLRAYFDKYRQDNYELKIIDVYQLPHLAQSVDIIALPLLIRKFPLPEVRLIGDMSDEKKVVRTLGLQNQEKLNDGADTNI